MDVPEGDITQQAVEPISMTLPDIPVEWWIVMSNWKVGRLVARRGGMVVRLVPYMR
jgi:hypothetical protein